MDNNLETEHLYYYSEVCYSLQLLLVLFEGRWPMVETKKVEEQIGEVLGLEIAAQKAVEELPLKGLRDKRGIKGNLQRMKSEAARHQKKIEKLIRQFPNRRF